MKRCVQDLKYSLRMLRQLPLAMLLFSGIGVLSVSAQQPTRTIEAVPAELAGVVRDTLGNPMRDAEVGIPILKKSARTDGNGTFVLAGVVPGISHEVWFRRIGFESVRFVWKGDEGKRTEIAVTLRPLPNTLSPTVVWANETKSLASTSVVSGIVVDSAGAPVAGADLQLIGADRTTKSAADGTFEFRHVPPGTVTLRARRMGYAPGALMIELERDDQRDVAIRIRRIAQTLDTVNVTEASGYGKTDVAWREFGRRERWRSNSGLEVTLGPRRLAEAGSMPLDWLLDPYMKNLPGGNRPPRSIVSSKAARINVPEGGLGAACILENGLVFRHWPLALYSANELDRVEYYPPSPPEREYTSTIWPRMQGVCGRGHDGGHPAWFVVWLKGAR
jgi:hypothetical protein